MNRVRHTLEPIYDKFSKTLILGSMPSVTSRNMNMYYANKSNRFWRIMETIYDEKISDYKSFILKHNLALWDVIESCDIVLSSDKTIKNIKPNNIKMIVKKSNTKTIFLLGRKAYQLYYKYIYPSLGIEGIYLPSTSSANRTKSFHELCEIYKIIKDTNRNDFI